MVGTAACSQEQKFTTRVSGIFQISVRDGTELRDFAHVSGWLEVSDDPPKNVLISSRVPDKDVGRCRQMWIEGRKKSLHVLDTDSGDVWEGDFLASNITEGQMAFVTLENAGPVKHTPKQ